MSHDYASDDDADDYHGDYTLEEYDVGPSVQQEEQKEVSGIDFRMDAPPPTTSMENRLRDASEAAPEGMQLARPSPSCCPGGPATTQTGPKAVKADYELAKQHLRNTRLIEAVRKERMLTGADHVRVDLQKLQMSTQEQARAKKAQKGKGSDEDTDEDEDDDAAFEQYRQQRIAFVQNSLPRFGTHTRVSKLEFANLVKSVHELCYVVCHLYQNNLEACVRLNLIFESLAPQFPHVKFVRLRSNEAMAGFKAAGLPALLVYKGGQMVTQALRVTDALPKVFGDLDVAKLLQAKGILTVPTGMSDSSSIKADFMQHTHFSDDENAEAEAENANGLSSGFNLLTTETTRNPGGLGGAAGGKKSKIRMHRAAESGSEDDSD